MSAQLAVFFILAAMAVAGAVSLIVQRHRIHSALSLIVVMAALAGLYLLQQAEFLFAVQIVLYVGGIMVLFLFVIMLVNLDQAAKERQFNRQWWIALLCVAAVGAEISYFMRKGASTFQFVNTSAASATAAVGNTEQVADVLFKQYLLPFEIASVLLLVAVVGSVVMAKKRI